MPHDPNTFKNLYPYPNKETIRKIIQDKILYGELKLPSDRMLDSKAWIEEQIEEEYKTERKLWGESENEAISAWQKHQEAEHGFQTLPETLRQKIHGLVWEMAHSGGFGDMENRYCDLVPLVIEAYEIGLREHLQR